MVSIIDMNSEASRYIAGFLLAVGLIVVVVFFIIRGLTSGPSANPPAAPLGLSRYVGTGTSMQLTIDSPVAAEDKHFDVTINVSNYQAVLSVTKGYENNVVRTQSYPMSTTSYAVFLRALDLNAFTVGTNDPALKDERGHCALGSRYIFEVVDSSGDDIQRYWHSTCGSGTSGANTAVIKQLFVSQIPDYAKLISDLLL